MADGLKWVMELFDRTSGPARKVASALDGVRVAQDRVRASSARAAKTPDPLAPLERATAARRAARQRAIGRELADFAKQQGQAGSSTSWFSSALGGAGAVLGMVAAAAIAVATAIALVGGSAARSAIEIAGFQESTMVAMSTMLGSRGAADREFDQSLRIARMTPFDTRNVVSMRRQLLGAGLRDERERDVMTGVIADLSALNPEDSTVMQRLGLAIGQIRGAGRLRGQELSQLVQAGLSREALFTEIGRALNLRGAPSAVNRQVAQLMEQGRITDRIAFGAMARAVTRMTNTSEVGQFSANQSTTIPGLLSTLGSAVPELLLGRGSDGTRLFESPGMAAFKDFLKQLVEALSSTSATGQRLQRIMRGLVDETFSLLAVNDKNTKGGFAGAFSRGLDVLERMIAGVRSLIGWANAAGDGFMSMVEPFKKEFAPLIDNLFAMITGGDGQTALWVFRQLGRLLGHMATMATLPWLIFSALAMAIQKIGEFLSWVWSILPEWFTNLFGDGGTPAPAPALAGANGIVSAGPGQPGIRPVISQPNVTVNVAATAANGLGLDDIAGAIGATIPGVVQTSAERASAGATP